MTSSRCLGIAQEVAAQWHRLARGEERNWRPPYEPVAPTVAPVLVAGHTDAEEVRSGLAALGVARAEAVAAHLHVLGVTPGVITVEGFGAERPLLPTVDPEPRNRRVELVMR